MKIGQLVWGAILGFFVGILGCVVHGGLVDLPIVGLVLATAMVAAGSWFLIELGKVSAWLTYFAGVTVATFWLLLFPTGNDALVLVEYWPSEAWLVLAPLSALVPRFVLRRR